MIKETENVDAEDKLLKVTPISSCCPETITTRQTLMTQEDALKHMRWTTTETMALSPDAFHLPQEHEHGFRSRFVLEPTSPIRVSVDICCVFVLWYELTSTPY